MRLSWNEVRARAGAFAEAFRDARYERGETQTFYNAFFQVFGVERKKVAVFEAPVKKLGARQGYIDLLWKGVLLVEQKSAGRDLHRAREQALDYFPGLKDHELPRYVLVSDFQTFDLYDLETREGVSFRLADLPAHVERFGFMLGVERRTFRDQDPANLVASGLMAAVHDDLAATGYGGHHLERFLVRLLFCLFADSTGIFPRDAFHDYLAERTREDGSDLGPLLAKLWEVLDLLEDHPRRARLDSDLAAFPYVNGQLFRERLEIPDFDAASRRRLLDASAFGWGVVSPAIFGSLFQAVMKPAERRRKGAHYTTEKNILKLIGPLFLDALRADLARALALPARDRRERELDALHARIGALTFLDPACGCGNFLVITYRELRRLETELLVALHKPRGLSVVDQSFDVGALTRVKVDAFYGIELEEFPARIAEVALWMAYHIENNRLSLEFGRAYARIPLTVAPHIHHADALQTDWAQVLAPGRCAYVFGNPPFVGAKMQTAVQRAQVRRVAQLPGAGGTLDYVAAWFLKAAAYVDSAARPPAAAPEAPGEAERWARAATGDLLEGGAEVVALPARDAAPPAPERTAPAIAFVATNSITQGEQVAQLWPILFRRYRLEIAFAHRTFAWGSDARGVAHVHVVIIGLARRGQEPADKRLFTYDRLDADPVESRHKALTPYLFGAETVKDRHRVVTGRPAPLNGAPLLLNGNIAADGGHLVFDKLRRDTIVLAEPELADLIRPFVGAEDLIWGQLRYCLWLVDVPLSRIADSAVLRSVIKSVRAMRMASTKEATRDRAASAALFTERRQPTAGRYLAIPRTSSERRDYIPLGYLEYTTVAANDLQIVPSAGLSHFAILHSRMHNAWAGVTSGRLKSDIRYSAKFTYNTLPWPQLTPTNRQKLEALALAVLNARAAHPGCTLADLYDPDLMPADLRRAHGRLDEAVDRLYRRAPFSGDRDRAEHLFGLYEALTAGLLAPPPAAGRRRRAA